jgi:hypothetical protein
MASAVPAASVLDQLPAPYCEAVLQELSAIAGEDDLLTTLEVAVKDAIVAYIDAGTDDRAELAADLAVVADAFSVAAAAS